MLTTRERADRLRAEAAEKLEQADELQAQITEPVIYFVPVDPADATICEGCE